MAEPRASSSNPRSFSDKLGPCQRRTFPFVFVPFLSTIWEWSQKSQVSANHLFSYKPLTTKRLILWLLNCSLSGRPSRYLNCSGSAYALDLVRNRDRTGRGLAEAMANGKIGVTIDVLMISPSAPHSVGSPVSSFLMWSRS